MPFKELKELRKSGNLQDALQMANQELESDPDNIWTKRGAAWVYYDLLKLNASPEKYDEFLANLKNLNNLNLPEEEKMVFDNSAYQIGKIIFAIEDGENTNIERVNSIFEAIQKFHFTKPSENYSFLLKAFQTAYKNNIGYLRFADWWGFRNLLQKDYQPEEFNGRKLMSLAEKAYDTYAKQLLKTDTIDGQPVWVSEEHQEKIREFIPELSQLIENHPEYQYPPFYKAKLLLLLGNEENALSAFVPFAQQKKNDFWVWDLMAGIFPEEDERHFACYCKALSLKTREDFLVKLRRKFAAILIKKKLYAEARTEIEKIITTKTEKGWKISPVVAQWTESDWYRDTKALPNNHKLYNQYKNRAEEILFSNIPEEVIAIEFVNREKKILNFVKDKNKHGFFKYSGFIKNPEIGDKYKVRFKGEGKDGFYKILNSSNTPVSDDSDAIKSYTGTFKQIPSKPFGFIEDIFVDPVLVKESNMEDGEDVKGIAILSFNKKRNEWGWKALSIGESVQ